MAFSHGIAVTPLHLVTAMASIVNGGQLRPATLLRRDYGSSAGTRYAAAESSVGTDAADVVSEQVIKPEISTTMRQLMRLVVEKGSGKAANIPGYLVGGKTGTAEKLKKTGGYDEGNRISSFVAAFPIDAPRYIILGLLDEPKGNKATYGYATAGWVSAPMVGRMIARIAPMAGIPPHPVEFSPKTAKASTKETQAKPTKASTSVAIIPTTTPKRDSVSATR
ncbi:MAG: penicillin-binding transpeptidase domain-containing protein [Alphaproteobacteria bacterium]